MATRGAAWLITWEGTNPRERLAAVLHWRTNEKCVAAIVELLYALQSASVEELVEHARKPMSNPYRVTDDENGFYCGYNPHLYARMVSKLKVEQNATTGVETISWTERRKYRLVRSKHGAPRVEVAVADRPDQLIRRPKATRLWRAGP